MATIDERIVSMVFENAKFEAGVAKTLGTLSKLDEHLKKMGQTNGFANIEKAASKVNLTAPMSALDKLKGRLGSIGFGASTGFSGIDRAGSKVTLTEPIRAIDRVQTAVSTVGRTAPEGFGEIEKAASRVSLDGLTSALDSVTAKFSVIKGAASVALGNLGAQAGMRAGAFAKSFSLGPVQQGFEEYQTNLQSIQTILANTSDSGGNLKTVNAALQELNHYSDQTIYNFSQMAKNIGTFTAAGVRLKPATAAIKGIANLAALSGANSQKASDVMYQLSQAIASGKVSLQDWASVVHGDMGGAIFQKALMRTAENMGTVAKGAVKIDKATGKATVNGLTFRESITAKPGQKSWLTSDVLTNTLSQFTGDLTDAQLAAKGFNDEQIAAIQKTAKSAKLAATEVKTLPQVFDVAKETIGSGWSATFQSIFGDFGEAKKTFTGLSNTINGFINVNADARNKVLKEWKKLGGRTILIEGIKNAFKDLGAILKPIGQAFRDIFPRKSGKDLLEMTKNFRDLTAKLKPSQPVIDGLRRTFRGLFAVMHIGWTIFKSLIGVVTDLLGIAGKGSGGILNLTGSIGDFLTSLDKAVSKGHALSGFFAGLTAILRVPLDLIRALASSLFGLFGSKSTDKVKGAKSSFDGFGKSLGFLKGPLETIGKLVKKVTGFFGKLKDTIGPIVGTIANQFVGVLRELGDAIAHADYDRIANIIQTGLLGAIFFAIKKGISSGIGGVHIKAFTADLSGLNKVFHGLTGNLQTMQRAVKAATLLVIASAIGVLAVGVHTLAGIDDKRLTAAMSAIAVGLGELVGAMHLMTTGLGLTGFAKLPFIAASILILAGAIDVLAIAVELFGHMELGDMEQGLLGVGGALVALGLGLQYIGPRVAYAPAILLVAVAMNILAAAVKQFGEMDLKTMEQGILGVGGALVGLGLGLEFIGPTAIAAGPALIVAAIGMILLSGAVRSFGDMDWETLARGLIGFGTSMLVLGGGLEAIPITLIAQAAALVVAAVAIAALGEAVKIFGTMDPLTMVKGIVAMGASLVVLAVGMAAMQEGAGGTLALLGAAAALSILAPTMAFLGTLKWSTIFRGLVAIAGILTVLGVAGYFAAPPIEALGMALLPVAGALAIAAAATWIFAQALVTMGSKGAKGVGVLLAAITGVIVLLPKLMVQFVKGILETLKYAAEVAPEVADALAKILDTLINVVITEVPKMALAWGTIIDSILYVFLTAVPKLINAGITLIAAFLQGLAQNMPTIALSVANIVLTFLTTMAKKAPDIAKAGGDFVIAFLSGLNLKIGRIGAKATELIGKFIGGVVSHLNDILGLGGRILAKMLEGLGENLERFVTAGKNAVLHVLTGIGNAAKPISDKAVWLARKLVNAMIHAIIGMADVFVRGLIDFMNAAAKMIRKNEDDLWKAGANLAEAMMEGFTFGIAKAARSGFAKAKGVVKDAKNRLLHPFGGGKDDKKKGEKAGGDHVKSIVNGVKSAVDQHKQPVNKAVSRMMSNAPGLLDEIKTDPTVTPVLDLTQVKKDAGEMDTFFDKQPVSMDLSGSTKQAVAISTEKANAEASQADAAAAEPSFSFVQHNTSPEPLSTAEIYRRTNNQVSKIKKEVGIPDRRKPR